MTGVILGIGRALGETMAIIMVMGNAPAMPEGLLDSARTLTATLRLKCLTPVASMLMHSTPQVWYCWYSS